MRVCRGARCFPLSLALLLSVAAPCSRAASTDALFTTEVSTEGIAEMNTTPSYPELISVKATLLVIEQSDAIVEENVTIGNPAIVELRCNFSSTRNPKFVYVFWKKDNDRIKDSSTVRIIGNTLQAYIRLMVTSKMQMASYSCIFEGIKERKGTFHFKVPKIHIVERLLVNYIGDNTILICKCNDYGPLEWIWFAGNESEKIPLDITQKSKYEILPSNNNETKLHIKNLQETDAVAYWCRGVFLLGESEAKQVLKVLSYMVPLRPFLAVVAEVLILLTGIFLFEMYTRRRQIPSENEKDFAQAEQLRAEIPRDNQTTRQRKNEVSLN